MNFTLQVNAIAGNGNVQLGNINDLHQHGQNVSPTAGNNAQYDQFHSVTWSHQGGTYDAIIGRVRLQGGGGPLRGPS
jgi:hypothetical protein